MTSGTVHKQMLVVRGDLKMGKGKIAVQCCHGAVASAEKARKSFPQWWKSWLAEGQSKVAVKVMEESTILELESRSREAGLPCYVVRDRGLTQVEPDTVTCIAIGPAPVTKVDPLTEDLPLL